MKEYKNLMKNI